MRQPRDVRVHDHTDVDAEGIAQNDIGGFAPDAVEVRQFLHRAGHLAVVPLDQFAATGLDVLRLVTKKARRPDGLLQFGERCVRVIRRRAIFFEQFRRDDIDALVRALGGKNGGDEQFKRASVIQLAVRLGVSPVERRDDFLQSRRSGFGCFTRHFP